MKRLVLSLSPVQAAQQKQKLWEHTDESTCILCDVSADISDLVGQMFHVSEASSITYHN